MNQQRIDEIRARCKASTPAPWCFLLHDEKNKIVQVPIESANEYVSLVFGEADARFISCARTDIPAMLEYIGQLQAENAELRARLESAVELPIKYGDIVYKIKGNEVIHNHVKQIHLSQTYAQTILSFEGDSCLMVELGKTVFLARKEAETALNARRTEDNAQ